MEPLPGGWSVSLAADRSLHKGYTVSMSLRNTWLPNYGSPGRFYRSRCVFDAAPRLISPCIEPPQVPLSPVRHKQNGFWLRFPGAHGGLRELRSGPWCVFYSCDAGHHSRLGVPRVASWFGKRWVQPLLSAEPPTQVGSLPAELVHHWQDCSENRISIPSVGAVVNDTPSLKPLMVLFFSGGYPSHVKSA